MITTIASEKTVAKMSVPPPMASNQAGKRIVAGL